MCASVANARIRMTVLINWTAQTLLGCVEYASGGGLHYDSQRWVRYRGTQEGTPDNVVGRRGPFLKP